jgi:hypothetical protein
MKCDHCENEPRHTLRAKTGPGQWQMVGKICDEHLTDAVHRVSTEQSELAPALQVIPFSKRDWPAVH